MKTTAGAKSRKRTTKCLPCVVHNQDISLEEKLKPALDILKKVEKLPADAPDELYSDLYRKYDQMVKDLGISEFTEEDDLYDVMSESGIYEMWHMQNATVGSRTYYRKLK